MKNILSNFNAKWERENSEYLQRIRNNYSQQVMNYYVDNYYYIFAHMLKESINNTSAVTQLVPIENIVQLFTIQKAKITERGYICLNYKAYYHKGYGIPALEVNRTIQNNFNIKLAHNNMPKLRLFMEYDGINTVNIELAFEGDIRRSQGNIK